MSAMTQCRWEGTSVLERFEKDFKDEMIDVNYYSIYLQIQTLMRKEMESYREFCIQHMSYNPEDQSDPRNRIRACSQCGEIWIKEEDCDGFTICGNRMIQNAAGLDSGSQRPQTPFLFTFENDDVQIYELTDQGWRALGINHTSNHIGLPQSI